SVNSTLQIK
nr:56 kda actin-sequestering protein, ASP-56=peptide T15 [swine, platelets, Peptide Partial, 9 aa] [Sus scrofa]